MQVLCHKASAPHGENQAPGVSWGHITIPELITGIKAPRVVGAGQLVQTQLEKNDVVPTSSQDEALAHYSVSREVPCSVLKWETQS